MKMADVRQVRSHKYESDDGERRERRGREEGEVQGDIREGSAHETTMTGKSEK